MQLYHTFISYSRADGEFALKLANDLRQVGVNIWLDQIDIPPGARWDRAVENALETSGRILVVLSPTSSDSENVQDEIGVAFDNDRPIIPVLYKPCEIPMRLRRLQFIDFTENYEQGLQTLLTVMKLPTTTTEGSAAIAKFQPTTEPIKSPDKTKTEKLPPLPEEKSKNGSNRRVLYAVGGALVLILIIFLFSMNQGSDTMDTGVEETDTLQPTQEEVTADTTTPEEESPSSENLQPADSTQ